MQELPSFSRILIDRGFVFNSIIYYKQIRFFVCYIYVQIPYCIIFRKTPLISLTFRNQLFRYFL